VLLDEKLCNGSKTTKDVFCPLGKLSDEGNKCLLCLLTGEITCSPTIVWSVGESRDSRASGDIIVRDA